MISCCTELQFFSAFEKRTIFAGWKKSEKKQIISDT